jgi:hypothetical protein
MNPRSAPIHPFRAHWRHSHFRLPSQEIIMRTTTLLATLALLTATIGTPALAASHSHKHQRAQPVSAPADDGYDHGMQTVPHSAAPSSRATAGNTSPTRPRCAPSSSARKATTTSAGAGACAGWLPRNQNDA